MSRRDIYFSFVFLSVFLSAGCTKESSDGRPPRAAVSGIVVYKGQDVAEGAIQFVPADGNGYQAFGEIRDGVYFIEKEKGPSVGRHHVKITGIKKTGEKYETEEGMQDAYSQIIPKRYNEKTTLSVEVKSENNTFNHELE